jgi:hypothetical protein
MLKKLLLSLAVLFFAYYLLLPTALEKKQQEFNAAGVSDTSILDLLDADDHQDE